MGDLQTGGLGERREVGLRQAAPGTAGVPLPTEPSIDLVDDLTHYSHHR
jgi:hypothetical protein